MDGFCGSKFWDSKLTWYNENQPDFTPCFQETVLIWVPAAFLFLFGTFDLIISYQDKPQGRISMSILGFFKITLTVILALINLGELLEVTLLSDAKDIIPLVDIISPTIKLITFINAFILVICYRRRGVHTSGILFTFWSLVALASIIEIRSLTRWLLRDQTKELLAIWNISDLKYNLRLVSTPIVLIQLVLNCIADQRIANWDDQEPMNMIQSPEADSSIFSWLTFSWLDSLIVKGYRNPLKQSDLYGLERENRAKVVCQKFDRLLNSAVKKALDARKARVASIASRRLASSNTETDPSSLKRKLSFTAFSRRNMEPVDANYEDEENKEAEFVSMFRIIVQAFWPRLLLGIFLKLADTGTTFLAPLLLSRIISFTSGREPNWRGILYAIGLFLVSIADTLLDNQETKVTNLNVVRGRTCVTSALYRKTLRLSNRGKRNSTSGQIVNLMSIDAQRVADFIQNLNIILATPILLGLSLFLLYEQLGSSTFAGLLVMLINIPFNAFVTIKLRTLQRTVMGMKDKRVKLLSEIFNGIKNIKLYAWEDAFKKRTENYRAEEIKFLKKQAQLTAAISFAYQCLPFLVILVSFATFVLTNSQNVLTVNRIFVSLSLFNIIRSSVANLPNAITNLSLCLIAVKRLNKFFERDEIDPNAIKPIEDAENNAIRIVNGKFKWDSKGSFALDNINITIPRGKLVAIVGPVGSGKSSLVSAMLGDMEIQRGEVQLDLENQLAYVPQEAWILNETIKNNIKLTVPFDQDKYSQILDACALLPDLKTLPFGDESEIGEKGLNLSGGQKQRISLARAVYADAQTYIFDDPLSAVDAHVGRHIFDNIIGPRGLLADRTRVLVTNKLSVLLEVDHIIVLKDGQVTESGTYEQLLVDGGLFSQLLIKYLMENSDNVQIDENAKLEMIDKELKRLRDLQEKSKRDRSGAKSPTLRKSSPSKNGEARLGENGNTNGYSQSNPRGGNLTGTEVSAVGSVGWKVHWNFVKTMGLTFMVAVVMYFVSSTFTILSSLWLSAWSNDSLDPRLAIDVTQRNLRLGIYAALGFAESGFLVFAGTLLNFSCLSASKVLHNTMLARVLEAPISWFNMTPSGRIINRFSKDIDTVDVTIRFNVRIFFIMSLRSLTSLILVSIGSVYTIVLIVPIVICYIFLQILYIPTSRQLKRIESTTRSPIYTHFAESIAGASSIRAFKITKEFSDDMDRRVDRNNSSYYMSFTAQRWLTVRLKFLGFVIVLIAALAAVLSRDLISPGIAALSVTFSLTITNALSTLVKSYSDYETNVVSVERLIEYTKIPIEPQDDEIPSDPDWPSEGRVKFDRYSARYRPDLGLVIRDFSLEVKSSEKVGLVGRTGAGKSSLILSIFRLIEPASGQIVIDDIDIALVSLKHLRSRITIIPQEPILFTGTIRQNVDPASQYTDEQIWQAINVAHLSTFMRSLPAGLDYEVSEYGGNFSVGQKQLICLARAILRRTKILVLDEATASVDLETDNLIQQTIRKEFKSSTIITIAHRLETIIDYDRVVVMDDGKLVEADSPSTLLKRPDSRFYGLAKEAGLAK